MNTNKIVIVLLSICLVLTMVFSAFLYVQINEKNSEIESRDIAIQSALLELQQRDSEIASKNSELEAKNSEIASQGAEIDSLSAEVEAKNSEIATQSDEIDSLSAEIESLEGEIADLRKPKIRWEISYTDHREELALPGYHLMVTGTITNYGVTDVYNVKLHVLAYYASGEIAINKTEPPGAISEFPSIPAGTTYEVSRWVYYEPGLIDTVTITPLGNQHPKPALIHVTFFL